MRDSSFSSQPSFSNLTPQDEDEWIVWAPSDIFGEMIWGKMPTKTREEEEKARKRLRKGLTPSIDEEQRIDTMEKITHWFDEGKSPRKRMKIEKL